MRNEDVDDSPDRVAEAAQAARSHLEAAIEFARERADDPSVTFAGFEKELAEHVFAIARSLVVIFLVVVEQRVASALPTSLKLGARRFRRGPRQQRQMTTMFGVVRYARMYMRGAGAAGQKRLRGFHPTDAALGLGADRFSMSVLALAARMATKMSYAEAKATVDLVIPNGPSTEVIQQTVLGLGNYTEEWFRLQPAPDGDGDVMILMIDSKGVPMASDEELERRRGKRDRARRAPSARHRGRADRASNPRRPRKKSGDCSKNARMVNVVVMYTLKRDGKLLLGPLNRRIYASFGTKDHAFQIARREANKRGFHAGSGKLVQIVTDGDLDLQRKAAQYFPEALKTIDFIHVVEKLWEAGTAFLSEGTSAHRSWVAEQKKRLRAGECRAILRELRRRDGAIPKTGPGNKGRHERLQRAIRYFETRLEQMNYATLIEEDLEYSTGQIEGVIKCVVAKRCDHGGMRWIQERAQAVLQLRCIEINGDWDAFIKRVHDVRMSEALKGERSALQTRSAKPLPTNPNAEAHRRARRRKAEQRDASLRAAA